MFFQLCCLLPTAIFTADIIDSYFRAIIRENADGFKLIAAIFGFLSAFLIVRYKRFQSYLTKNVSEQFNPTEPKHHI